MSAAELEALALIVDVLAEGDGSDDDAETLEVLGGFAAAYPAAYALGGILAAGDVRTDDGRAVLSRVPAMYDAPWHVTGAAVRGAGRGDWRAHDTLGGACATFAELAGLEVSA